MRWYRMNVKSKYAMGIIMTTNKFIKLTQFNSTFDEDTNIVKDSLNSYLNSICYNLFNTTHFKYDVCDECLLNGNREYDGWCTCILLIYLNKSLIGCWRNLNGRRV